MTDEQADAEHERGDRIRVVLADDSYLVREAIASVLADAPGIDLVASCEDRAALMAAVDAERPDVVLTDIRMPPAHEDEGIQIANDLRSSHPQMGVVVLSQFADARYGVALLEGGADRRAYLLKERISDRRQLIGAIEAVAHGGSFMDAKIVEDVLASRRRAESSPLAELTPRELEILAEIARGKSNAGIAADLVLSKRAVEKHINSIFLKLGLTETGDVSRRVKAALIYLAERPDAPRAS